MASKPILDSLVRSAQALDDILAAGDDALGAVESVAGMVRRHRAQARKARNAAFVMRPWHEWRRDRLADRLRAVLGLPFGAPLPAWTE